MLTYNFHDKGKLPIYICLYNQIKADILGGILMPNEKLPSKRNLAQHLKISVVSVENAYAQLILEGYIYALEKKGYFVSPLHDTLPAPVAFPVPKQLVHAAAKDRSIFDFQANTICSGKFPFSIWAKLMRQTLSEQAAHLLEATPYNGILELRKAIADHLYRFRGISVLPEQIVIGAGTEYLYSLIVQLLGRNRIYALEDPGYQKIAKIYQSNDASCVFIGLDNSGLSLQELEASAADIVHISPAHHFPTGIVMPIKRRHELLQWANKKEGRYILEDDYDSEFRFSGKPVQTLQSIDVNEKVIYINTFSKSIAPSIRISFMVLPEHLMNKYREDFHFYSCTVPSFEQFTLAKFIANGYFERHINRMRHYYKRQRDSVIHLLKCSPLRDRITILEEDSGLHFLMKIQTNMSDEAIVKAANKQGIRLSCLSNYFYDPSRQEDGVIIVNYSGIDYDKTEEAMQRLIKVFM